MILMSKIILLTLLFLPVPFGPGVESIVLDALGTAVSVPAEPKLNQIQVIGTHNSYHAGIAPSESKIWQSEHANDYKGLDYQHRPIPEQLESGVRQIELD